VSAWFIYRNRFTNYDTYDRGSWQHFPNYLCGSFHHKRQTLWFTVESAVTLLLVLFFFCARKSRRRSSLFSLSSVDLNTATCDSGNSLRLSVEPDSDDEPGQDEPGVPPFVRVSAETAKNPDEDALIAETAAERSESPAQVDSERSPLAGADENKTILDDITMEVTDPLDSSIVLGEQTGKEKTLAVPESRVSRKVSAAKTKQKIARCDDLSEEEKVLQENEELHNKRRSKSKRQSSNNRGTSASVKKNGKRRSSKKEAPPQDLDFSFTDSFVINPDKKIKVSSCFVEIRIFHACFISRFWGRRGQL